MIHVMCGNIPLLDERAAEVRAFLERVTGRLAPDYIVSVHDDTQVVCTSRGALLARGEERYSVEFIRYKAMMMGSTGGHRDC